MVTGTGEVQQDRCKEISCRIREERLAGTLDSFVEQGSRDLGNGGLERLASPNFTEDIPIVCTNRPCGLVVVADNDIAWVIELVIEIALSVEDQHDIILRHASA